MAISFMETKNINNLDIFFFARFWIDFGKKKKWCNSIKCLGIFEIHLLTWLLIFIVSIFNLVILSFSSNFESLISITNYAKWILRYFNIRRIFHVTRGKIRRLFDFLPPTIWMIRRSLDLLYCHVSILLFPNTGNQFVKIFRWYFRRHYLITSRVGFAIIPRLWTYLSIHYDGFIHVLSVFLFFVMIFCLFFS